MIRKQDVHNSKTLLKSCFFILILLFFCSCAGPHYDLEPSSEYPGYESFTDHQKHLIKIKQLQQDLVSLSNNIVESEAEQLAESSINYSLFLADEYRLVRPPYLHNILVRIGIKDRGLCYHWSEDLLEKLTSLELKSFILHRGVAYRGSNLREHNCVVVTAMGQDFSEGIVLDPWRDSGDLYWTRVNIDRYSWEKR